MRYKVFLALIFATYAFSGHTQENAVYACVDASGGVRIVDAPNSCASGETPREWAVQGPQGPPGPPGPAAPVPNSEIIGSLTITDTLGLHIIVPIVGVETALIEDEKVAGALNGLFTVRVPLSSGINLATIASLSTGSFEPGLYGTVALYGATGQVPYVVFAANPTVVSTPLRVTDDGKAGGQALVEFRIGGVIRQVYQ
jgi:hypothetical protein